MMCEYDFSMAFRTLARQKKKKTGTTAIADRLLPTCGRLDRKTKTQNELRLPWTVYYYFSFKLFEIIKQINIQPIVNRPNQTIMPRHGVLREWNQRRCLRDKHSSLAVTPCTRLFRIRVRETRRVSRSCRSVSRLPSRNVGRTKNRGDRSPRPRPFGFELRADDRVRFPPIYRFRVGTVENIEIDGLAKNDCWHNENSTGTGSAVPVRGFGAARWCFRFERLRDGWSTKTENSTPTARGVTSKHLTGPTDETFYRFAEYFRTRFRHRVVSTPFALIDCRTRTAPKWFVRIARLRGTVWRSHSVHGCPVGYSGARDCRRKCETVKSWKPCITISVTTAVRPTRSQVVTQSSINGVRRDR